MNQTRFKIVPIAEDGFASMRGEWNSLLASSAADNIFLTWEWLFAWWGQFKSGKELCLLAITDGARLAGIAPFYLESRTGVIRFLKLCGAEELYPDYLDLIAAPGEEQAVTEAVAGWLLENSGRWDVLSFDHVLETSAITRLKPYFDGRFEKDQIETSRCPNIKVGGSFDDYLKTQFKRKKRYNLERQVKILMEDKGCVFQKAEPQNGWDGDLDRLFRLHGKRSSEKDIVSSFDSENIKAFHKTFAGLVQGLGILDLRFLLNGGEPVSSSYGFRYKKKLYYYQSGLDPEWQKLSAGTVLLTLLVKQVFEDGLGEFDFLKGEETYKRSWMTGERVQFRLRFFNNTLRAKAYYQICRLKNFLKNKKTLAVAAPAQVPEND